MENFTQVASTTTLRDARQQFLDNDITNRSNASGVAFPTANLYVGMFCFRTDDGGLYQLKSIGPNTWVKLFDIDTARASDSELLDGQEGSFYQNASNLNAGTVPSARISGAYTGFTNVTGSGTADFARFLGTTADTAAAPSFSFTQDPDTGLWSPAADQMGVSVGGVNRATFSTTLFSLAIPQNLTGDNYTNYGANSTWAATLRVGGNGYATASKAETFASVVTTNGNLHIDAGTTKVTYLNFYSGSGGVVFGNGANAIAASMDSAGQLWQGTSIGSGNRYWHAGNDGSGSGLDADLLDGLQLQANRAAAVGANQVIASQGNGYVYLNYINTNTPVNENPTIGQVFVSNNSDNAFVRKASVAHLTSSLSGTAPISITGNAGNASSISNAVGTSYNWTNTQNFGSNGSGVGAAGQSGYLGAYSTSGAPATMHFHRAGLYAINMGLDTDNVFRLGGWSDGANVFRFTIDAAGNFTARGTLTESSDRRLKKKLKKHKVRDFLALQPYEYVKKAKGSSPEIGFMAQDVAEHYPEFVQTDSNGYLSVSYARFVVPMIAKMGEQQKRIESLEERVARMEKLIARMGK